MGEQQKRYHFVAEVTISVHAVVEADSEAEAREALDGYAMGTIHEDACDEEVWRTSGELDGEPCNVELFEVEEADHG